MSTALEQNDQDQRQNTNIEKPIVTVCQDCVFSVKDNITNNQFECSRGRLSKYRSIGIPVDKIEDENGDYFAIRGRICIFARDQKWLDQNFVTDVYSYDVERKLIEETTIKYHAIIIGNDDYVSIKRTIKSLEHQDILPQKITVVISNNEVLQKSLISYFMEHGRCKWNVLILQENEDELKAIDGIAEMSEIPIYTVAKAGYKYDETLFGRLNEDIVENLKQIAVILPDSEGNGFVCSRFLHKTLMGNRVKSLTEKIEELKWELPTIISYIR